MLFRELAAQRLKVGQSGVAVHCRLAIGDQVMCGKSFCCVRDLPELLGPVVAAARIDGHTFAMDMHLRAIAIDLDFVQPSPTIGRAIPQGRIARLDESGEWRSLRAGNAGGGRRAITRTPQGDGTHADSIGSGEGGSMAGCLASAGLASRPDPLTLRFRWSLALDWPRAVLGVRRMWPGLRRGAGNCQASQNVEIQGRRTSILAYLMRHARSESGLREPLIPQALNDGQRASNRLFSEVASVASREAGRTWMFAFALGIILVWAVTGPLFNFSDTWQL